MAAVPVTELSTAEAQELICTYAALILHDGEVEVTADNLEKVIAAANGKVETYLPKLFARLLNGADVATMLANVGTGGGVAAAPGGAAAGGDAAAAPEAAAAAAAEEEEEVMDFDLFD